MNFRDLKVLLWPPTPPFYFHKELHAVCPPFICFSCLELWSHWFRETGLKKKINPKNISFQLNGQHCSSLNTVRCIGVEIINIWIQTLTTSLLRKPAAISRRRTCSAAYSMLHELCSRLHSRRTNVPSDGRARCTLPLKALWAWWKRTRCRLTGTRWRLIRKGRNRTSF